MNPLVKKSLIIGLLVLIADQALKIWVKTHMYLGESSFINWDWSISWFQLSFTENPGMAFGWKLEGEVGKYILSIFRIIAIIGLIIFIGWVIKKKQPTTAFVICMALVTAGAIGNLCDSMFYGMMFGASGYSTTQIAEFMPADGGYAPFLQGKVVDMLYFPIIDTTLPEWMPFKGGEHFVFFSPIFNIADAAVTVGVFTMILFHKRIFPNTLEGDSVEPKEKAI